MALPEAVQRQVDAAEAMMAGLAQGNTEPPTPEAPPAVTPPAVVPEIPAAVPTSEAPVTPPPAQDDQTAAQWKARHDVLQGKYNAEVPRLHQQIADLRKQIAEAPKPVDNSADVTRLTAENDRLRQQVVAATAQPPVEVPDEARMRQEFGDDLVNFMVGTARNLVAPLQAKVDNSQQLTEQQQFNARKASLEQQVRGHGLDFTVLNDSKGFSDWLDESDPFAGVPRRTLMQTAFGKGDINRTTLFFTQYASQRPTEGRIDPSQEPASPPPLITVQPTTVTDANRNSPTGRVWDEAAVKQLHRDYQAKRISDDEFKRLELEMMAALTRPS